MSVPSYPGQVELKEMELAHQEAVKGLKAVSPLLSGLRWGASL